MSQFFATCPKGLENLLLIEIQALGVTDCRETVAGVYFDADIEGVYRVCLWSRLANRVLMPLEQKEIASDEQLYEAVYRLSWEKLFDASKSIVVDFIGTNEVINNSQYGALKVKDAVVDRFLDQQSIRPNVDKKSPDIRINARLDRKNMINIALDLSGGSLHMRGYRGSHGLAPMKENLAAALLYRSKWPELSKAQGSLVDPMCGSATLLIEAALMAGDIAPGIFRKHFGFEHLYNFDSTLWGQLRHDAERRRDEGLKQLLIAKAEGRVFQGFDQDDRVLKSAKQNTIDAGLDELIELSHSKLATTMTRSFSEYSKGLVIANPPYGERLGEREQLIPVYEELGALLERHFTAWQAAIFTSDKTLGFAIGYRASKRYSLYNGTIPTELLCFEVDPKNRFIKKGHVNTCGSFEELSSGAQMVYNRLKKNQKQLKTWLTKQAIDSYRLYNADLPEYAAIIDIYNGYAHVQEYAPPKTVDKQAASKRFNELLQALQLFTGFDRDKLITKQRRQQKGSAQYEKVTDEQYPDHIVHEYHAKFYVNLKRYLDTGLFLDHRGVRRLVAQEAAGKRVLNLFCYTATATVQAILSGASSSVSVDMSATYIAWARRNFELNAISSNAHQLVQADCLQWLRECREGFDLIILDPPSFSNSKRMDTTFDVQRDHELMIERCMELLARGGKLLFSNNLKGFRLSETLQEKYCVKALETLDPDCQRNVPHRCWSFCI